MNLLVNLLMNLSPNSFQIVIYEHFCVCMDIWWFTCMPVSFFVHLSAYFYLLSRHNMLTLLCNKN